MLLKVQVSRVMAAPQDLSQVGMGINPGTLIAKAKFSRVNFTTYK